MRIARTSLIMSLLAISTTTVAAEGTLTRSEVKRQTLVAICLGEETAVGDSGKTSREKFPEQYKRRMAMCNQWIKAMPAGARKAEPPSKQ